MPDNYVLYGPGGASPINIGTWLRADPGPDFGAKDLVHQEIVDTPAVDGGAFVFEAAAARQMVFPLTLASGGGLSLPALESVLRQNARPGGFVDLQPQGVPSAEAVRFDIIAGRYEEEYGLRLQPLGRRHGALKLTTAPYGYWPTWITLASCGTPTALPVAVPLDAASVIGDRAALIRVAFEATVSGQLPAGTWMPDLIVWGIGGASLPRALATGATVPQFGGTWQADSNLPGLTATRVDAFYALATTTMQKTFAWVTSDYTPYAGRYRLWAWMRLGPSQPLPFQVSADVIDHADIGQALASAAPIATLAPAVASGVPGAYGAQPSPAFNLLDLGEITIPRVGPSIAAGPALIRLWTKAASTNIGISTAILSLGGLHLQPLDQSNGVMPRGLVNPTVAAFAKVYRLQLDSDRRQADLASQMSALAPQPAFESALRHYRGGFPQLPVGSSAAFLAFVAGRKINASTAEPVAHSGSFTGRYALEYRPRFAFLKGI